MALIHFIAKLIALSITIFTFPLRVFIYLKHGGKRRSKQAQKSINLTQQRNASSFGKYNNDKDWYCTDPKGSILRPLSESGIGSRKPVTIIEAFKQAVQRNGEKPAIHWQSGAGQPWKTWTWKQYYDDCIRAARSFIYLGLEPYQSVNILGFNSPEWFIANNGAIFAQSKSAGVYATDQEKTCRFKAIHSQATVIIVETVRHLNRYITIQDDLKDITKAIVIYGEEKPSDYSGKIPLYSWKEFLALSDKVPLEKLNERMDAQKAGDCCTLIYTSGTTGEPKAVMISHDNLTWTSYLILSEIPNMCEQVEHFISYLPLSHVAAQMLDIHGPMIASSLHDNQAEVWFARPDALRGSIKDTLTHARPTMFFGVPRVWEKFREAILLKKRTGILNDVAQWAKGVAYQKFMCDQFANDNEAPLSYPIAQKLLSKVRVALGLDRCRYCISGAAPISRQVLDYFASLDIPVHQVYGASECTGPATLDHPARSRIGTVGSGLGGVEIRIDHKSDRDKPSEGEICYRGRNIMMGYMNNEQKTKDSIDKDGWYYSGDVGRIDENGFLHITGRIKELLITAGGENIAPTYPENEVKKNLPAISNAMLVCDRKKFVSILLTLKTEQNMETERFTEKLTGDALKVDTECKTVQDAKKSDKWKTYIQKGIDQYNKDAVSRAQWIRAFRILDEDFSTLSGDLTATLKVKRPVITKKYQHVIDEIYPPETVGN